MTTEDTESRPRLTDLYWARPEPEDLDPPLSRAEIAEVAVGIADREGLDAVTIERAGAVLGSRAPSLPHHIWLDCDLVDVALDTAFGEALPPAGNSGDYRADLREIALALRAAQRRHRWFAAALHTRPLFGPNSMRFLDVAVATLEDVVPDITEAMGYVSLISGYVGGASLTDAEEELSSPGEADTWDHEQVHRIVGQFLGGVIASGDYPSYARFLQAGAKHAETEAGFRLGLDCLLDGIAARITGRRPQ
ncbi:TetR/AcrR family transcriptional regulator C-terminal domain-containing protein [Amycolatopsis sp. NBC_00345]|uniref:TetR/AcrR family transcriptional regulator C-terminal domain-containing protein n=1 Tax=Amycolatopsis sp. NBC_00345 TaxID=2975955 RepID=UPI002E25C405